MPSLYHFILNPMHSLLHTNPPVQGGIFSSYLLSNNGDVYSVGETTYGKGGAIPNASTPHFCKVQFVDVYSYGKQETVEFISSSLDINNKPETHTNKQKDTADVGSFPVTSVPIVQLATFENLVVLLANNYKDIYLLGVGSIHTEYRDLVKASYGDRYVPLKLSFEYQTVKNRNKHQIYNPKHYTDKSLCSTAHKYPANNKNKNIVEEAQLVSTFACNSTELLLVLECNRTEVLLLPVSNSAIRGKSVPSNCHIKKDYIRYYCFNETVTQVTLARQAYFAITQSGTVYAWGDNSSKVILDTHFSRITYPVAINFLFPGPNETEKQETIQAKATSTTTTTTTALHPCQRIQQASGGFGHVLFLTATGEVVGRGANAKFQAGNANIATSKNNDSISNTTYRNNFGSNSKAIAVQAGADHSLALLANGDAYGWGWAQYGQVGVEGNHTIPAIKLASNVCFVNGGWYHSLFLQSPNTLSYVGWNISKQLPYSTVSDKATTLQTVTLIDFETCWPVVRWSIAKHNQIKNKPFKIAVLTMLLIHYFGNNDVILLPLEMIYAVVRTIWILENKMYQP